MLKECKRNIKFNDYYEGSTLRKLGYTNKTSENWIAKQIQCMVEEWMGQEGRDDSESYSWMEVISGQELKSSMNKAMYEVVIGFQG